MKALDIPAIVTSPHAQAKSLANRNGTVVPDNIPATFWALTILLNMTARIEELEKQTAELQKK